MKTATLPSTRIEPEFRERLEASLKEGETISEFIEGSLREPAPAQRSGRVRRARAGVARRGEADRRDL